MEVLLSKHQQLINAFRQTPKKYIRNAFFMVSSLLIIGLLARRQRNKKIQQHWSEVAKNKRLNRDWKITQFKLQYLKDFALTDTMRHTILNSSISQLKSVIHSGQASITEVLLCYIERTIELAIEHNWLAEVCFEEAIEQAQLQDQLIRDDKDLLYQNGNELLGIPVTVKDHFILKGTDATIGLASRCMKPYSFDGNHAYMIKKAGGIIFAKTNMPQIGFTFETNNHVFGRALNPINKKYTTGGSSGGEGGMMAGKCSIIGLGSDVGGSIRFPAGFSGVYGYKPSSKRVCKDWKPFIRGWRGWRNIEVAIGPIGRYVDDLARLMKVLLNEDHYETAPVQSRDADFIPRPFNDQIYGTHRKLRIGYFKSFRIAPSSQANQRALQMAIEALQRRGHTLVPIDLKNEVCEEAYFLMMSLCQPDEMNVAYEMLQGESYIPEFDLFFQGNKLPYFMRGILSMVLRSLNLNRLNFLIQPTKNRMTPYDFMNYSGRQSEMQEKMAMLWAENEIDSLVMPLFPTCALLHSQATQCFACLIYALIWNFYDYSAGVVPVTVVGPEETVYDGSTPFTRRDACTTALEQSMAGAVGLPLCVQVITPPLRDELCLSIMKELEQEIGWKID